MTHPNDLHTDRYYDAIDIEPSGPPPLPRATETSEAALEALVAELVRMVRESPTMEEMREFARPYFGAAWNNAVLSDTFGRGFTCGGDMARTAAAVALLHRLGISDDDIDAYDRAMAEWRERKESEG